MRPRANQRGPIRRSSSTQPQLSTVSPRTRRVSFATPTASRSLRFRRREVTRHDTHARPRHVLDGKNTREKRHHDDRRDDRPGLWRYADTHCACAPLSNSTTADEREAREKLIAFALDRSNPRSPSTVAFRCHRAVKSEETACGSSARKALRSCGTFYTSYTT